MQNLERFKKNYLMNLKQPDRFSMTKLMRNEIIWKKKFISLALAGGFLIAFSTKKSRAISFNPNPIYETIKSYTTTIPVTGNPMQMDITDIYYPESFDSSTTFPLILMLQGAEVDKRDYSNFASQVASYGFVVAVPNHRRKFPFGLFPVQELTNDVLEFMKVENMSQASPLQRKIDVNKMGLLGHSFGGPVGLGVIQGNCFPILCITDFTRPEELKAGIFYGTRFGSQDPTSSVPPIFNQGIPIGLIAGTLDGVISPKKVEETYNQIQESPKVLVNVLGANHYGITNEDNKRDQTRPTLPQEVATETIARWSALFLRAHVQGDAGAFDYVYRTGEQRDENVTVTSAQVRELSKMGRIFRQ